MKKNIYIIIILSFITIMSSYSPLKLFLSSTNQNRINRNNNYIELVGREIIDSLKEQNKIKLNSVFCDKIKDSEYLNKKLDIVFDYIKDNGGVLFLNENFKTLFSHGSFGGSSKTVDWVSFICEDIKIGDIVYDMHVTAYIVLKKHPEFEGVNNIVLQEKISQKERDSIVSDSERKSYLGVNIANFNHVNYKWNPVVLDHIEENDLYLIPNNLEADR